MTKKIGNDHAMSYVRKISLVAGSISALALMSTTKAAQAAGVTEAQAVSSGEIAVDWDLDALDTNDEMILASDTDPGTDTDTDPGTDTDTDTDPGTDTDTEELCTVTENNADTCIPISDTLDTYDSDTSDMPASDATAESGALPSNRVVATETFTFDVANASSNLVALSVAANW
jgi:hypothetical protein